MNGTLDGQRVVVVGASAGIGRAVAVQAARRGAKVMVAARRGDELEKLRKEAGGSVTGVVTDVCLPGDADRLAQAAKAEFGSIDMLVYSVGYAPLARLRHTGVDEWQRVLLTNVVGASQVIGAVLPVMRPAGIVAALSSETVGAPRLGLGAYASSKAALEESFRGWRLEEPQVRFCIVTVGATLPTGLGDNYDAEVLVPALLDWARCGSIQEFSMRTETVAATLMSSLAAALPHAEVGLESLRLRSPAPVIQPTADLTTVVTYASTTPQGEGIGITGHGTPTDVPRAPSQN